MARWRPDAPQRLVLAALELFEEQGYDDTTVMAIARRAELTKSTFFRHFSDKREVLFGGDTMGALLVAGIADAPPSSGPLEAIACALDALGADTFMRSNREFSARRRAVISAHPALQEREALKGLELTASMTEALKQRGVPEMTARIAAEMGALGLRTAYERWSDQAASEPFADVARRTLHEIQTASSLC